jgi:hypothetical protein
MKCVVLDFETYYDEQYSLSRMTTAEYIRDPRFEVIGYFDKKIYLEKNTAKAYLIHGRRLVAPLRARGARDGGRRGGHRGVAREAEETAGGLR